MPCVKTNGVGKEVSENKNLYLSIITYGQRKSGRRHIGDRVEWEGTWADARVRGVFCVPFIMFGFEQCEYNTKLNFQKREKKYS